MTDRKQRPVFRGLVVCAICGPVGDDRGPYKKAKEGAYILRSRHIQDNAGHAAVVEMGMRLKCRDCKWSTGFQADFAESDRMLAEHSCPASRVRPELEALADGVIAGLASDADDTTEGDR